MGSKVPMSVSFYDLNYFLAKEGLTVEDCTEEQIKEILFFLGMETEGYEVEEVLHRPLYTPNNSPWKGKRYIGWERRDKEWLYSKKSSIENVIACNDDVEHVQDLMNMSRISNNTLEIAKHIEKHAEKQEVV